MKEFGLCVAAAIMAIMAFAAIVAVNGVVLGGALSILWGWFVAPLGVGAISAVHAYGLTIITSLIHGVYGKWCDKKDINVMTVIGKNVMIALVAIVLGYITHTLM